MKIYIEYDSKYSLSTMNEKGDILNSAQQLKEYNELDKNNMPYLSKKRNFKDNILETNKIFKNFKYITIQHNTIIGILSRLIGDVRRIEELGENDFIKKIEKKISWENKQMSFQNEIIRLSNKPNELANGTIGVIDPSKCFLMCNNDLSEKTFGVFEVDNIEIIKEMLSDDFQNVPKYNKPIDQTTFINLYKSTVNKDLLKTLKIVVNNTEYRKIEGGIYYGLSSDIDQVEESKKKIKNKETSEEEKNEHKNKLKKNLANKIEEKFFFSFLFMKYINFIRNLDDYKEKYENLLEPMLNVSQTSIKGIAPESGYVTEKNLFADVAKKNLSWNLPLSSSIELYHTDDKGEGKVKTKVGVTKETGELIINIDLSKNDEILLLEKIENAGVNTFHLGKKGLAYVSKIELEKQ